MALTSCVQEDPVLGGYNDDNESIRVSAVVAPSDQTRVYFGSGEVERVTSGIFYLTFPKAGNETSTNALYRTATVDFDASASEVGYAYFTNDDGAQKDLKWKHVWNEGNTARTFYMHNINPEYYTETYTETSSTKRTQYYQKVSFKETSPFYTIRPLDKDYGTNDIITGSVSASNSVTNGLEFSLNHRLSLLKLKIDVYASETDNRTIDLSHATVTMSNLYTRLSSFSISYPTTFGTGTTYSAGTYSTRAPFTIKGNEEGDPDWEDVIYGSYLAQDGLTYKMNEYRSLEFVIPPQPLVSGYTPEFIVKVPKEDVTGSLADAGEFVEYKGKLPESMFTVVDGVMGNAPIATAFTSGTQLNVVASINSPDTELHFAPVTVETWVSKGTYTINTNQGGIYNLKDFQNMVAAYRSGNRATFEKYGYSTSDGSFVIQFWSNVEIPEEVFEGLLLKGCMEENPENPIKFMFLFNGNVIKVTQNGSVQSLEDTEGQLELYNIVTGENVVFTGVTNKTKLEEVRSIINGTSSPTFYQLKQYAYFDNLDNTLIIDVTGKFDINIDVFFQIFPAMSENYSVMLSMGEEAEINVIFSEEDNVKMNFKGVENITKLNKIGVKPLQKVGIYNVDEFMFLKDIYNNYCKYYEDILGAFAEKSGSSWNLYFRSPFTVKGEDFFGALPINTSEGLPSYSIGTSPSTITIEDEFIPCNTNSTTFLAAMLKGSGTASNYDDKHMKNVVNYYNSENLNTRFCSLWSVGGFDREKQRWVIPLAYSKSPSFILWCYWDDIFGKMIPDPENGFYDYEFDFTNINNGYFQIRNPQLPEDDPRVSTGSLNTGTKYTYFRLYPAQDGPEALRQLGLGTYNEWYEERENGN